MRELAERLMAVFADELARSSSATLMTSGATMLGLLAVLAEVAWMARRPGLHRTKVVVSAATALTMAAGAAVVGFAYAAALRRIWPIVGYCCPAVVVEFWTDHRVLAAGAAFVTWDGVGWVYHWIGHRTAIGWAAHQPHHTGSHFDLTLGLRQSWTPVHGLVVLPLTAAAGFGLPTVVLCSAVSGLWQLLVHTSFDVRFPSWFKAVVMTPDTHRHHHGCDPGGVSPATNLGPVFTVWDRLAGTWVGADVPWPERYGLVGGASANPFRLELAGWFALFGRRRSGAGTLGSNAAASGTTQQRSARPAVRRR